MKKKILVIDNDMLILNMMTDLLEEAGHQVVTAEGGIAALDVLKTYTPDIILVDLIMPDIDGHKLCRIIRGMPALKDAYVVILSAVAEEEKKALSNIGANAYIVKGPMAEMAKHIHTLLEQGEDKSAENIPSEFRAFGSTSPRRISQELLEVKNHFEIILGSMSEGIVEVNADNKILYVNPSAVSLLGMSDEKLLGMDFTEFFSKPGEETRIKRLMAVALSGGQMATQKEPVSLDDKIVTLELLPVKRKEGKVIAVLNDITEKERAEEELGRYRQHLEDLVIEKTAELRKEIIERTKTEEELQGSLKKLETAVEGIVKVTAMIVEIKDPYTSGHQRRVTELACAIAKDMDLPANQIKGIQMAASIHDLGKVSTPADILVKPSQLTDIEYSFIKSHPQVGYDILKEIEFAWPIAQIVYQHHERMDGSGYPLGISGEDILFDARIIAVADTVEAMSSHRPYRSALGMEEAIREISQERGTIYDPDAVDACVRLFHEKEFRF
jgi:PAS domain S-box-containing protein